MSKSIEAENLSRMHSEAAHLLSMVADDDDVMAAIRRVDPDLADQIEHVDRKWKDAGQVFLKSLTRKVAP